MSKKKLDSRKCAMIGCGFVGSASVYALMQSGLFSDIVLIDANKDKAEGEALDISHGIPFAKPVEIIAGDYPDISDASIVIITAGAAQKPGETRLDLVKKNVGIFKSIIPEVVKYNKDCTLLIVANPVDVLTYAALKLSGFPKERVIGSGTVLDTARFKYLLGEHLDLDSRSIHAFIIGEHGDSEIAAWSSANVSGVPIHKVCEMRGFTDHDYETRRLAEQVKNAAYEIIDKKGATYYGIGMAIKRICEAIIRDERSILPVSTLMTGQFGLSDVCLSMPAIVGEKGVDTLLPIELDDKEMAALKASADTLKAVIADSGL
ncbi:MAG: L-lactate dehydrogenase [Lachnospiraceae bacterium]|nr:L-lactate dehydrogenase [Lachnospiraceae bacterium]